MISLIAGKYKGRKLFQLRNTHVRPTQAKVRKSVFQILEPFSGLEILDLYAGVGTFGLEALSRGAASAVFVEKDHLVYKILEKNTALFHKEKMKLHLSDTFQFICRTHSKRFDIIFADPPYTIINFNHLKEKVQHWLKPGGIFCMEMKKQDIDEPHVRIKYYGNTQVVFWKSAA